jgi:segregation and condensation protein A
VDEDLALSPEALQLHLEGFEGPLDLLLDLARRQRVDLAKISIVMLVDQYIAAVSAADRVNLPRAVEWLVMAAWLTWLKSRLLLPKEMEGSDEAELAAGVLADRLADLERVRAVTDWLEARPQLGRDMFERGRPEIAPGPTVAADFVSLFQVCLDVLRGQSGQRSEIYRPPRRLLWTVLSQISGWRRPSVAYACRQRISGASRCRLSSRVAILNGMSSCGVSAGTWRIRSVTGSSRK